jgi:hypothetical protein
VRAKNWPLPGTGKSAPVPEATLIAVAPAAMAPAVVVAALLAKIMNGGADTVS